MLFLYFLKKYLIPNLLSILSIEKFKRLARRVIFLQGLGECINEKKKALSSLVWLHGELSEV